MRLLILLIIGFFMIFSSGCYKSNRLDKIINPPTLFEQSQDNNVGKNGEDDGSALLSGGGQERPLNRDSIQEYRGTTRLPSIATVSSIRARAAKYPHSRNIKLYINAGIALSNHICNEWFMALGEAQSTVNADRDVLSNLGALGATIMGLAGAPAAAVGGVAGGFGFVEGTMTSELANFIVAPSVAAVEETINAERKIIAEELYNRGDLTFYQADKELGDYHNTCSHNHIKRVVDKSLTTRTNNILADNITKRIFDKVLASSVTTEISKLYPSADSISIDEVVKLYAVVFQEDLKDEVKTKLIDDLKSKKIDPAKPEKGNRSDLIRLLNIANSNGLLDERSNVFLGTTPPAASQNLEIQVGGAKKTINIKDLIPLYGILIKEKDLNPEAKNELLTYLKKLGINQQDFTDEEKKKLQEPFKEANSEGFLDKAIEELNSMWEKGPAASTTGSSGEEEKK